ncbi:MAG: hypothetical protein AB7E74_12935 [Pirellulales bacterium]
MKAAAKAGPPKLEPAPKIPSPIDAIFEAASLAASGTVFLMAVGVSLAARTVVGGTVAAPAGRN